MARSTSTSIFVCALALSLAACFEDPAASSNSSGDGDGETGDEDPSGDGDGDSSGDGDGDPSGDGDGDPSGDGDGDPSGDGDGDPSGDGDGDPSGDGDVDPEPAYYSFSDNLCEADISSWTQGQPTVIQCNGQGTPNEGWARTYESLGVENEITFGKALEVATFTADDGLIQVVFEGVDISGAMTPVFRTRVGCSALQGCSAFWQIVIREVGLQEAIWAQDGVQFSDGAVTSVEFALGPHKNKSLEIVLLMTNNDTFDGGDVLVFDNPRIADDG